MEASSVLEERISRIRTMGQDREPHERMPWKTEAEHEAGLVLKEIARLDRFADQQDGKAAKKCREQARALRRKLHGAMVLFAVHPDWFYEQWKPEGVGTFTAGQVFSQGGLFYVVTAVRMLRYIGEQWMPVIEAREIDYDCLPRAVPKTGSMARKIDVRFPRLWEDMEAGRGQMYRLRTKAASLLAQAG